MFSLRLLTSHNYSGQTYELNLESLPSVSELIEGMHDYLEEKFGLTFPALPDPFKACDDLPLATVVLPPAEVPLTQPAEEQASARAAPFKSERKSSSRTARAPPLNLLELRMQYPEPVSYTHLTLPTILLV